MNWNVERTLDEVEAGIVSPERSGGMKPEGELTFRDGSDRITRIDLIPTETPQEHAYDIHKTQPLSSPFYTITLGQRFANITTRAAPRPALSPFAEERREPG